MRQLKKLFVIALLLSLPQLACASFTGHLMEAHVYDPPSIFFGPGGTYSSKTFTVNDSVEVALFGTLNESSLNVSGSNILVDFWRPDSTYFYAGYYVFQDIQSTISDITGVTINLSTTDFFTSWGAPVKFDQSRITFDANTISINFAGLAAHPSSQLSLDVAFSAVPVPASAWLLFSGILALLGFNRKYRHG